MDLWECDAPGDFWGSVGASGTEGNLWALYLAREALPAARLLYSREAHYSIPKAARILRIDASAVDATPDGAIDLEAVAAALAGHGGGPLIVALTCGTTVRAPTTTSPASSTASTPQASDAAGASSTSTGR